MRTFDEILASGKIDLYQLEFERQERKKVEAKKKKTGLLVAFGIAILGLIIGIASGAIGLIFFIAFGVFVGFAIWWSRVKAVYVETAKQKLINNLVRAVDESFIYNPNQKINESVFRKSNLVRGFNRYSGEDFFQCNVDGIPVEFSEITAQQKNKNSTSTVFKGPFFVIQNKQPFAGRAAVVPDNMEKLLGGFGRMFQSMNFLRDHLLQFSNPEFEKHWAIYSTNEQEAKQVINDQLISLLFQIKTDTKGDVFFGYEGDKIYLALHSRADIFKIDINNEINEASLRGYYDEFLFYLSLVQLLYGTINDTSIPPVPENNTDNINNINTDDGSGAGIIGRDNNI